MIDYELLAETYSELGDALPEIEASLNQLVDNSGDLLLVANVFRAFHTIKGNFALAQCEEMVGVAHVLESVLGAIREDKYRCTPLIAEALLHGLDLLRDATAERLRAQSASRPLPRELVVRFTKFGAATTQNQADEEARLLIAALTGVDPAMVTVPIETLEGVASGIATNLADDLDFFSQLTAALEARNPFWAGRTDYQVALACAMNAQAGRTIDENQLIAAVYLHDIGMAFLPETILLKHGQLDEEETASVRVHPVFAHGFMSRVPGWEAAALMVRHHHERLDGKGYPDGIKGDQIVPGGRVLAIVDAFFAMTHRRADRDFHRSVLRGVSEINACSGTQFDPAWVEVFNTVIRAHLSAGIGLI